MSAAGVTQTERARGAAPLAAGRSAAMRAVEPSAALQTVERSATLQTAGRSAAMRAAVSFLRRHWPELVACACAIVLYLPAAHFGFVFDDAALIGPGGEPRALGGAIPYRPLRYASYLLDFGLGGSAAVYHLHNVALHALAAGLATTLARRLGATRLAALAGGLVVALHPVAAEAAAYVSGRRDLLCVVFGLGALLAHIHERTRIALVLLLASVASKESGLVFAAPLAAAIATGARARTGAVLASRVGTEATAATTSAGRTRALVQLAAATGAAAAFVVAYGAVGPWLPGAGLGAIAHAGTVLVHYASSLAGAHPLSPDYPALLVTEPSPVSVLVAIFAAAALVAASLLCVQARRSGDGREQAFVFAWTVSTVAALAIWGGVHEPGADRHAYLALPPLGVGLALVLSQFRRSPFVRIPVARVALATCGAALALVAAFSTRSQMEIWRSDRALWSHAARQSDASPRAHANMARIAAADGDLDLAQSHLARALAAGGNDPLLLASRAALRCAQGRRPLAARDLRRARGAEPGLVASIARDCELPASIRLHRPEQPRVRPVEASGK